MVFSLSFFISIAWVAAVILCFKYLRRESVCVIINIKSRSGDGDGICSQTILKGSGVYETGCSYICLCFFMGEHYAECLFLRQGGGWQQLRHG